MNKKKNCNYPEKFWVCTFDTKLTTLLISLIIAKLHGVNQIAKGRHTQKKSFFFLSGRTTKRWEGGGYTPLTTKKKNFFMWLKKLPEPHDT